MRFLKTLTLNRRAVYDSRVALDTSNNFTVKDSTVMTLPNSSSTVSGVTGMIRYNNGAYNAITNPNGGQVEVYQNGYWRALRYKESTGITQQNLGNGDYREMYFGPLNPAPPSAGLVESGATWGGQNLLVIVENVIQIYETNYDIVQHPIITGTTVGDVTSGSLTITLSEADIADLPTTTVVTGSSYLQSGTTATVTSDTQVTLSLATSGGTIPSGTTLTFTLGTSADYYLLFSSPVPLGKPVIVLHGFDQ